MGSGKLAELGRTSYLKGIHDRENHALAGWWLREPNLVVACGFFLFGRVGQIGFTR